MVANFHGYHIFMDFVRFLIHENYEVLCTWCYIFSAWFLDTGILTCYLSKYLVVNNHYYYVIL